MDAIRNSGSDFTTLWTTPQPRGTSTIIQWTATSIGEGIFSDRTLIMFSID